MHKKTITLLYGKKESKDMITPFFRGSGHIEITKCYTKFGAKINVGAVKLTVVAALEA